MRLLMKNISLKSTLSITVLLTATTLSFTGCSSYSHATNQASPIQQKQTNLGSVLTDNLGMTLYTFDKDKPNVSNCNNGCAIKWPPLLSSSLSISNKHFSIITRADNTKQWALDGKPLYRWFKDKKPGDTTGDGVKSVWHVAKP